MSRACGVCLDDAAVGWQGNWCGLSTAGQYADNIVSA